MKRKLISLVSLILLLLPFNHLSAIESNAKSIAIVLKVSGNAMSIGNTEVSSFNIFYGNVKHLNKEIPVKTKDILKIKVADESNSIIYEGYYENPLNQKLESFEEYGEVNNNILPSTTGYINLRFPLQGNHTYLTITTYTIANNNEALKSTLKFNLP